MGGVPTNIGTEVLADNDTVVPGLYAAGEVACVSVHGANRLGTNSLLDIVVFGRRGGHHMARYAAETTHVDFEEKNPAEHAAAMLAGMMGKDAGHNAADIRAELQSSMFDLAFVVRSEEGLTKMQGILESLHERYRDVYVQDTGKLYNTELMEAVELGFLLDCAEALVAGALARDESRGGHYREDHPLRDDDHWLKHTLAYREPNGSIRLDYKDVKMGPYIPMERKY
jgi:succinate dehydrogenase / fumarate reductase flavoprotein subunit